MDDAEARAEHAAFVTTLSTFAEAAHDGQVRDFGGAVAVVTGTPIPIFNGVVPARPGASRDDVAAACEHMRSSGLPWSLYGRVGVDDDLVEGQVSAFGTLTMPGMVLQPIPDHSPPTELEIVRVTDPAGYEVHVQMVADVFGAPVADIRAFIPPGLLELDHVSIFTGHVDATPVATSLGVVDGHVVTLFNVATMPDAQRRGYGAAMTMAPALEMRERGVTMAALQSTEDGFPVYEGLGYRTVVRYQAQMVAAAD